MTSTPGISGFLEYYEKAHRNRINRYIHHGAHTVAVIGALALFYKPLIGVLLILAALPVSWSGHYFFERNTPAFFDEAASMTPRASLAKKLQVALGGVLWTGACFWRAVTPRGQRASR